MTIPLPVLKDLQKRVQASSGADAEIDARVLCAFAAPAGSTVEQSKINGAWTIFEPGDFGGRPRVWENRTWQRPDGWPLSGSIEAALDFAEQVYRTGPRAHWVAGRHAWPIPENVRHYALFPWGTGAGASTPLAILAAVLQAQIAAAEKREPVAAVAKAG